MGSFYFWLDIILTILSLFALAIKQEVALTFVSICGLLPVLFSAIKSLINRKITVDLLASIALIFALVNKEFYSAVFISLMLVSARFLARFTEDRSRQAIKKLLKLKPTKVLVKSEKGIIEKSIEKINIGDLIIISSGERVAVDGVVVEGTANVDQSSLTGESKPIFKKAGDEVLSSTLNISGSLVVKTVKVGQDTAFAKIVKLVEESQKEKAPISSVADKFSALYIILTIIGSLLLYFFTFNLKLVLAVLLVTCADDLAIAIPLAFTVSIGTMARKGIIVKGASFIEGLSKIKLMIFDKTGTITEGRPKVKRLFIFNKYPGEKFLGIMGGLNIESGHPTAKAICRFVKKRNIDIYNVDQIHEEVGYGIGGVVNGEKVLAGNLQFLKKYEVNFSEKQLSIIKKEKSLGNMLVALAVDKSLIGFLTLSDSIRHHAPIVMKELKKAGVERIVILTGDNETVTGQIAEEVGIIEFQANLLPRDKINFIKSCLNKKYKVGMVGDGINDAASLALVDISFAMGGIGSDATIEAADIALMKDDLLNITDAMKIGKKTMKIINQNLILWGVINLVGLALVFLGIFGPSAAALYNFISDFIPPANSLRLLKFSKKS
jgi:Zn2+/Cd2+-exporting ATPase